MQRAGVDNHLVVALDDETKRQVEKFGSTAVRVNLDGDEEQKALNTGSSHAVSGALSSCCQQRPSFLFCSPACIAVKQVSDLTDTDTLSCF